MMAQVKTQVVGRKSQEGGGAKSRVTNARLQYRRSNRGSIEYPRSRRGTRRSSVREGTHHRTIPLRKEIRYRITGGMAAFQLMLTATVDIIQAILKPLWAIPFLGLAVYAVSLFLSFTVLFILIFWFKFQKVPVFFGKGAGLKMTTFGIAVIFESLPVLNLVPALTVWAATTIAISRRADRRSGGSVKILKRRSTRRSVRRAASLRA